MSGVSNTDLVKCVKDSGVVGAGGAGFPSHVKLAASAEYVIINGAECEPLLRVDQQLLRYNTDEIISGLEAIIKGTGAKKGYICIKGKHKEAVDRVSEAIDGRDDMELSILQDFYPAGDEQVLVYEVTGRVVPEGGIPLKVGCIVTNVETVLNINAALSGKPVTHTYLTVAGDVPSPVTVKVPVGMTVKEVLSLAGDSNLDGMSVIDGGPMMGKLIKSIDSPVTKTTKGLIVLNESHPLIKKKIKSESQALRQSRAACLQCRMCTDMCPRYLLGHNMQPHLTMRKSKYSYDIAGIEIAALCSECGVCEMYACPAGLSPKLINVYYKKQLAKNGIRYSPQTTSYSALSVRDYRKVPVSRLISRLGLSDYDVEAPLVSDEYKPKTVRIPLKQHAGAPAIPVVSVGQDVEEGQLIGEVPEGSLGARVHSSIRGRVTEISDFVVIESIRG